MHDHTGIPGQPDWMEGLSHIGQGIRSERSKTPLIHFMNTCKTCKHWTVGGFGTPEGHGDCGNPKLNVDMSVESDGLTIRCLGDNVGWSTGPDFGCVHHEPSNWMPVLTATQAKVLDTDQPLVTLTGNRSAGKTVRRCPSCTVKLSAGEQTYQCEGCQEECCTSCSENGENNAVICDGCNPE